MKDNKWILMLTISLVTYYLTKGISRYLIILGIVVLSGVWCFIHKNDIKVKIKNVNKKILVLFLLPIIYYLSHSFITGIITKRFSFNVVYIKEFLYIFIPILLIFIIDLIFEDKKQVIDYIYYSVVIAFIIQSIILNIDYIITNIGNPNRPFGLFENHILTQSLVYFLLYQLYSKDYKKAILSIILILMGNKRVVYIGLLMTSIPLIIININKFTNQTKAFLVSAYLIISQILYVFSIKLGILQQIMTMFHIDDKWRSAIWGSFLPETKISLSFIGNGVGYVINKLHIIGNDWYPYLYNEPLKYYIEIGLVGFLIFAITKILPIFLFEKFNNKYFNFIILSFSFFTFVVFFDNLNFYQEYMFLFISVIYFSSQEYKDKIESNKDI